MKDQDFGDINDYRKYGLLRALQASDEERRLLVAWMLSPDDGGPDGGLRAYLDAPERWARYDPELFHGLTGLLHSSSPAVSLIEGSRLLPRTTYHRTLVPDDRVGREVWRRDLLAAAAGVDLVFLDPDNGVEVPSRPLGRKGSSKYVTWAEIEALWQAGCFLLIYQHFRRERRVVFAARLSAELRARTGAPFIAALRTPHVLFLLAAQARHAAWLERGVATVAERWPDQIVPLAGPPDLARAPSSAHSSALHCRERA